MARYASAAWRAYQPVPEVTGRAGSKSALNRAANAKLASRALSVTASNCRILGLDPGSIRTGFGLINCCAGVETYIACGCINVKGADLAARLRCIFEAVSQLVQEHQPDEIAIERVFMHKNADSALKLGQARGVALCAAVALGASAHEYAPRAIKLAVTGHGGAEKAQVAQMVSTLLSLSRRPAADAADALAVALCHAQSRRLAVLGAMR